MEKKIYDVSDSFGCRDGNILKLHLENKTIGERSHVEFDVTEEYCGYEHVLHGGIICTLLDEVMYYSFAQFGIKAVTSSISVKYHAPTLVGSHITLEAWVVEHRGHKIDVAAEMKNSDGKLLAESTARFFEVDIKRMIKN